MSQTWTDNPFASGNVGQTDLQNMENNFLAIKSMFSGASAPSNAVAGMPWFDTAQKVLKTRNNDNDAWLGLFHGDVSEKRIVYRDSAFEGYARDSGVTDKVIALKGGTTYTTGAATAGSWDIGDHTLITSEIPAHTHSSKAGASTYSGLTGSGVGIFADSITGSTGGGSGHNHSFAAAARIAAAVCILIYLDL